MSRLALVIALAMLGALAAPAAAQDAATRSAAEKHFRIGEKAYKAQSFAAAAEHFEEALKILPLPEIAFSAAQAYRRQFRVDRRLDLAKRAVELYKLYLESVKSGARVGDAVDSLESMEREVEKLTAAGAKTVTVAAVERTTIVINPELGSEAKSGETMREIADLPEENAVKVITLLDGKPVPAFERIDVTPGPHKIHVEAEGYLPADVSQRVVAGDKATANITLLPRPAKVTVRTERGARISVDGRPRTTGPVAELELPAGRHVVTILRSGREPVARELRVSRGEILTLDEPLEKTTRRKMVPWVAGAAGVFALLTATTVLGAVVEDGRASDKLAAFNTTGDQTASDVAEYRDLRERRNQLVTGAWVVGGATVLLGSAAAVLYWFDSPSESEVRVTPAVTTSGAGITLGGRF